MGICGNRSMDTHLMHLQMSKCAAVDFHKSDLLHQHNSVPITSDERSWFTNLISNDISTDLRVLNTLNREYSWITWQATSIRGTSTCPSWGSNELPRQWASLCWVRHIEIDRSSPSRTTTTTWYGKCGHYTAGHEQINIFVDLSLSFSVDGHENPGPLRFMELRL